jgi:hypothetical protein
MVLRYNRKGTGLPLEKIIIYGITGVVIIVVLLYLGSFGSESKNSFTGLSDTQCQFSSELCDNEDIFEIKDEKSLEDQLGFKLEKKGIYSYAENCKYTKTINSIDELEDEFKEGISKLSQKYNNIGEEYFYQAIAFETANTFSPCIINNIGAVGLIQFTQSTAKDELKTTSKELSELTRTEQLEFVDLFLNRHKDKIVNPEDIYWAIHLPTSLDSGKDLLYDDSSKYYARNPALDVNKDGKVYKSEVTNMLNKDYDLNQYS